MISSRLPVLAGPSRLSLEALLCRSFSTSAPDLFAATGSDLSKRKPQPRPFKLPKIYRKGAQDIVYGYEPGQRHPKRRQRVVAHLAETVYIEDHGERKLLGHAGASVVVDKARMRNELVPQGKAYYIRHGKPVVWPPPLNDWIPPEEEEARLQARRDKQIGMLHSKKPVYDVSQQIAQQERALDALVEQKLQNAATEAFAGGMTRLQRQQLRNG